MRSGVSDCTSTCRYNERGCANSPARSCALPPRIEHHYHHSGGVHAGGNAARLIAAWPQRSWAPSRRLSYRDGGVAADAGSSGTESFKPSGMADGPASLRFGSGQSHSRWPVSLASALKEGYATASNDTGHKGANASFVPGHPEKLRDFADRAVHEMAVKSKLIIAAFYGSGPKLSYWNGCSTGGRQGLMEAQRHPERFRRHRRRGSRKLLDAPDGGNRLGRTGGSQGSAGQYVGGKTIAAPRRRTPGLRRVGRRKGRTVLEDPTRCHFDPQVLQCKERPMGPECLTEPQVKAAPPNV